MSPDLFAKDGYSVVRHLAAETELGPLREACDAFLANGRRRAGARNLLAEVPAVRRWLATDAVRAAVGAVLGPAAFPVRGLFFDKTPEANWRVGWHQDVAIAVVARQEMPGYTGWSRKAGVWHVQPPADVLEGMVTMRLHLDPCGLENGPLLVLPGSHQKGRLDHAAAGRCIADRRPAACVLGAGDTVLMRPLLLHASERADRPGHRRVLHVEFAAGPLPCPLRWAEC